MLLKRVLRQDQDKHLSSQQIQIHSLRGFKPDRRCLLVKLHPAEYAGSNGQPKPSARAEEKPPSQRFEQSQEQSQQLY